MSPATRSNEPESPRAEVGAPGRAPVAPVTDPDLRQLIACLPDQALVLLDRAGTVRSWNPGAEVLTGHAAGWIVGRSVAELYPAEAVAAGRPDRDLELAASAGRQDEESWRLRQDGSRFWARVVTTALVDEAGDVVSYGQSITDLTARREAEEQTESAVDLLHTTVRTDVSTGFLNRHGWDEALRRDVALAERRGLPMCVAVLDLGLSALVPEDGETRQDAETRFLLLAGVAWRSRLRTTDVLARVGEGRFAVALVDCDVDSAMTVVERMRAATPAGVACSAGVACWDEHEPADELVDRAEGALRSGRAGGPERTVLASADDDIAAAFGGGRLEPGELPE